ncbi:MAG: GDSL-type esterase/lipase family protein [Actinomycetota bacterium]|nr:GDSL-type esterase/lipase family protein [Actinomycetota bacterium]
MRPNSLIRRPLALSGLATAPAIGGLWALCAWEARQARRGPRPYEQALAADGRLGPEGPPVRVAWLGDSLASGLGVDHVEDTPAQVVAHMLERPVEVTVLAVPGAKVLDVLTQQLPRLDRSSDLVVVCVGANDVAATGSRQRYADRYDTMLSSIAPIPTLALSLPDMSTPGRLAEPLRTLAGARARWFEAGRSKVVERHPHAASVDIASRPAGLTQRAARASLCADQFHPGPVGYRLWAERIATLAHELLPPVGAPTMASEAMSAR